MPNFIVFIKKALVDFPLWAAGMSRDFKKHAKGMMRKQAAKICPC